MSMYGNNPIENVILATLGFSRKDVPRYRDCTVAGGEIVVYTRMGGGNYQCWSRSCGEENGTCPFCSGVLKNMEAHPLYLQGKDDKFDSR